MVAAAVPAPGAGGWGGPGGWGGGAGGWGGPGAWGGAGVNPWIPPWVAAAPWMPQWTPCTVVGSTCSDCNTKAVCTKIGQLSSPCVEPTPYCNLGSCSATPTTECAPVAAVPIDIAA